ncbi:hypothetical protein Q0590_08485 [Rhodocytophaga aerolata]|uniref:Uncharacterized protein n=1 Tax=Rhodocytophaga aerolata TaxID=455078 RepID=A0ABT8R2G4_9BACT|nr:hypothetical protein [Rhodocytophaga aerolata]MDO1446286.1 hypothetical protein [Rhodocytophaga aerolata]
MPYYKIKVKSFDTARELWIAIQAENLPIAISKANEYCAYTRSIYYPLEQSLHEITKEEYATYMSKTHFH